MRRSLSVTLVLACLATVGLASGAPAAPAVPTGGLEFAASLPADVQRDQGEPEVSIDPGGNVYTCGPSGFSNIADYAEVSRDGGDQFHLLGTAPRGQISTAEGGGDCGLASAPVKNEQGQYQWAYTGLGPLTNFSTGTSPDTGQTLYGSPISESVPGVDRQWLVFTDAKTVFLNYNQLAAGFVVQKSTDGGYSYGPQQVVTTEGGRIGPIRAILDGDPAKAVVYFPFDSGTLVKLAVSTDGGETFGTCTVGDAEVDPTAGFVVADHDKAGNIFVTYGEKGEGRDSYVMPVRADKVAGCKDDAMVGTGRKILLNHGDVVTTVMPWAVASGEAGRFAVAYYGSDQEGDPNTGDFKGAWHVYVSMVLDAFAADPEVLQTRATAFPMHYDSICLNGTICAAELGDRTLVDYFAMDLNPVDGRLNIVYNNAAKKPDEAMGHVGLPVTTVQMAGPSLLGGTLKPKRARVRQTSSDGAGDALSPYGTLCITPPQVPCAPPGTANQDAADFVDEGGPAVEVGPEVDLESGAPVPDGGFTVTMRIADLSTAAKTAAATSGGGTSLIYLFRWTNGYQPSGATARWSPVTGWSFAYDGYETASTESGQADPTAEKIVVYPGTLEIPGKVDEEAGVIRMSVPRNVLKTLQGSDDKGRPQEAAATVGSLFPDAVAYSLVNVAPDARVQSYLYPMDNAPALEFRLVAAGSTGPVTGPGGQPGSGPGTGGGSPTTGTIPTTGLATGGALLAVVLLLGAAVVRRRVAR